MKSLKSFLPPAVNGERLYATSVSPLLSLLNTIVDDIHYLFLARKQNLLLKSRDKGAGSMQLYAILEISGELDVFVNLNRSL